MCISFPDLSLGLSEMVTEPLTPPLPVARPSPEQLPECWLCLAYCTDRKAPRISGKTSLMGPPSTCCLSPAMWPQSP